MRGQARTYDRDSVTGRQGYSASDRRALSNGIRHGGIVRHDRDLRNEKKNRTDASVTTFLSSFTLYETLLPCPTKSSFVSSFSHPQPAIPTPNPPVHCPVHGSD